MTLAQLLLDLQSIDTTADQLLHRRENSALRSDFAAASERATAWERRRTALRARIDELGAAIDAAEVRGAELSAHRQRLEQQLKTVIAPREAEALQHQIATLNERRGGLDDAELSALEEQSRLEVELTGLLGQESTLRAALLSADSALSLAEADIDGELANIAGRLDGLRAQVDPGVLKRYDRLRQHFVVAAAALSGSRCEGCHLDLSAHEVDDVKDAIAADGVGECPQCGRILLR